MPAHPAPPAPPSHPATRDDSRPVLDDYEAQRRLLLLDALKAALADLGIASTLARTHRLVLRNSAEITGPNGLTDPELHIFSPAQTLVATTDGTVYQLDSASEYPAGDPAAAAVLISRATKLPACQRVHSAQ